MGLPERLLTTVNHLNNDVWQLTAESRSGRREQLQPTGSHKFYSETRRDWVSTKEIHAGEVIRGRAGPLTLVDAHPLSGTRRVYNLTVEGEHVYYVSELGLLAHNNCPADPNEVKRISRLIRTEASRAVDVTSGLGVSRRRGRFGTDAHRNLELLLQQIDLDLRSSGSAFRLRVEPFRSSNGVPELRRAADSLGLDALLEFQGVPVRGYDLKTGSPMAVSRRRELARRFDLSEDAIEEILPR